MISPLHKVTKTLNGKSETDFPTLLFVHGNSASSNIWQNQFEAEILQDFAMAAFDLPGHGDSNRWSDYSVSRTLGFLIESCSEYDEFVLVGHSLGGHLAIEALPQLPNCKGLLIFGTPPLKKPVNLQEAFLPDERMALLFKGKINSEERNQFAQAVCDETSSSFSSIVLGIENTDPKFREGLGASVAHGELSDEAEILRETDIPIAILHGVDDALVNPDYIKSLDIPGLWEEKVHSVENSSHCPHIENPERFNQLLSRFLKSLD
ncbi:MAG: alpha/beta hydrolase [Pricia sp.]